MSHPYHASNHESLRPAGHRGPTSTDAAGTLNPRDPRLLRALRRGLDGCGWRDAEEVRLLEVLQAVPYTARARARQGRGGFTVTARCRQGTDGLRFTVTFALDAATAQVAA